MYGDYVVYVDESGDHSLVSIDSDYPIFVLSFCIFNKNEYVTNVVPVFQNLKFKYFGHDLVILRSGDIRKKRRAFKILNNQTLETAFVQDLSSALEAASFTIISAVIDKKRLASRYATPSNPYDLALLFCLERLFQFIKECGQTQFMTHVIIEQRGKKEDNDLELVFRRAIQGNNVLSKQFPFEVIFADKQVNSTGMQIADLVSQPIGRHFLNPNQPNLAFDVVEKKFRRVNGAYKSVGLKVFP